MLCRLCVFDAQSSLSVLDHALSACTGLHKQLAFELGEVYMEMMDLKASRMEAKLNEDPCTSPRHTNRST